MARPDSLGGVLRHTREVPEKELCRKLGATMINLTVDLTAANRVGKERPAAIETFLELMDNPDTYPRADPLQGRTATARV